MVIEKKPYVRYNLEESEEIAPMRVRLNAAEKALIEKYKVIFDIDRDSTVLKKLAFVGDHVLQSTFGEEFLGFLLKKDRTRYMIVSKKS